MADALYGPQGFYRRSEPASHFRTSVSASPMFAQTLARLVVRVDESMGHPTPFDLVDVGAGTGLLLSQLLDCLPDALSTRVRATAVEVRPRPSSLAARIGWTDSVPREIDGLVMAHEYLDNMPCDVVELATGARRQVLVDDAGHEELGHDVGIGDALWLDTWWPMAEDGDRAEVGTARDQVWADVVRCLLRGVALAVDYGHVVDERKNRSFPLGTLSGYRDGRQVAPTPDGTCDITAHVAIDATAHAGEMAGVTHTALARQRAALHALGLSSTLPDHELAGTDPQGYVRQLSDASSAAELLDSSSLGSFWWLIQSKGVPLPIGTDALSG